MGAGEDGEGAFCEPLGTKYDSSEAMELTEETAVRGRVHSRGGTKGQWEYGKQEACAVSGRASPYLDHAVTVGIGDVRL